MIGVDITVISRIEKMYEKFGEKAYKKFLKDYDKSKLHTIKDYLHIKTSVIMAESFMLNYTDKSLKWFEENLVQIVNFQLLDYCELVDTDKKQVA